MKVGLVSTAVPLILGGGRFIVDWLHEKLVERGHETEVIYLPATEEPDFLLPQMAALRAVELDKHFDRVITFRPQAHVVRHRCKVVWLIHHVRAFYDLWDTHYRSFPDNDRYQALRRAIIAADTRALTEARRVFTNSRVVSDRIKRYNGLDSEVLYPPVLRPDLFRAGEHGDEIVSVCRMEHHKRQHLLVEAMARTRTPVRLRLCGRSTNPQYVRDLRDAAQALGVGDRVLIEERWISEEEKADRLEHALASAYLPFDEDSYGYPTIEAAHARRCTITTSDSGGVPEFVTDGVTGLIAGPQPAAVARIMDRLYADRNLARRLGEAAQSRVAELGIDWDTVIEKLFA